MSSSLFPLLIFIYELSLGLALESASAILDSVSVFSKVRL